MMPRDYQRCVHCKEPDFDHAPTGQCLFAPTQFKAMTAKDYDIWLFEGLTTEDFIGPMEDVE